MANGYQNNLLLKLIKILDYLSTPREPHIQPYQWRFIFSPKHGGSYKSPPTKLRLKPNPWRELIDRWYDYRHIIPMYYMSVDMTDSPLTSALLNTVLNSSRVRKESASASARLKMPVTFGSAALAAARVLPRFAIRALNSSMLTELSSGKG